ncbi:MAG: hypothetical protein AAFV93_11500 [Chloroflexota bacterium]
MNPPLRLLGAFQQIAEKEPQHLLRLEERQMWVAAEIIGGFPYTIIVPDMNVRTSFDRRSAKLKKTFRNRSLPSWAHYMAGAVGMLDREGLEMSGANIVIVGDEPLGPRYEHALGLAFVALWHQINEQEYNEKDLISMMDMVRRDYISS